ncbi:hypothetical protein [Longimicrobium sp.]|uniref:hypothetical protein n=1 Tax=Longimicrobium sp. TaxID=2029185 RepID=UPI002B7B09C2|nr:hypothetical protein [Longimicrobium sp.]HSU17211.1 hypothetical protein [Longimicrobium sp.]
MSTQLESRHFLKSGDAVQHVRGHAGVVVESFALYAVVRWEDGRQEEVDQLDPAVFVTERAAKE